MNTTRLAPRDLLLGLAAIAVWGTNFVVIRFGLAQFPPLLFAALRFTLAVLPMVFLIRRPAVPWRHLAAYGVLTGAGQFGLLFIAMRRDISPGLASLVIQAQVFFTIGLSVLIAGERVGPAQRLGLLLGAVGMVVIGSNTGAGSVTPAGLLLVLMAALCWAGGNLIVRRSAGVNMLAYVVWASLFSAPPLFVLSAVFEGLPAMVSGLRHAGWAGWGAVVWQSVGNTLFGFGVWGFLMGRYPSAVVAPLALLVPVIGMATAAAWVGEPLPLWKLAAALLVLLGLAASIVLPRLLPARAA